MTEIIIAIIGALSVILQTWIIRGQTIGEKKRKDDSERMELLLEGQEACLASVIELGANGRATEALKKLESYKNKKASQ